MSISNTTVNTYTSELSDWQIVSKVFRTLDEKKWLTALELFRPHSSSMRDLVHRASCVFIDINYECVNVGRVRESFASGGVPSNGI